MEDYNLVDCEEEIFHNEFQKEHRSTRHQKNISETQSLNHFILLNKAKQEINYLQNKSKLASLRRLYLENNNIKAIPSQISQLVNLKVLKLSNNLIRSIPEEIKYLNKLNEIAINDNKIKKIPSFLFELPLKRLYFHGNEIIDIPYQLSKLTNIREVSFEWFNFLPGRFNILLKGYEGLMYIEKILKLFLELTKKEKDCTFFIFIEYFHFHNLSLEGSIVNLSNYYAFPKRRNVLQMASFLGFQTIVKSLIQKGFSIDLIDSEKNTALLLSIKNEQSLVAEYILNEINLMISRHEQ